LNSLLRTAMTRTSSSSLYSRIYALVRQVPPGRVTAYSRIARQAGCTARTVGFAMAAPTAGQDVPWQRVINSQGRVSLYCDGDGNLIQRSMLKAEGVRFDAGVRCPEPVLQGFHAPAIIGLRRQGCDVESD